MNEFRKKLTQPHVLVALGIAFVMSFFLIGKGIWLVQDNMYNAKTVGEALLQLKRFFSVSALTDNFQSFFGYDAGYVNISRITYAAYLGLIVLFRSAGLAQYIFIFAYVIVAYLVNYHFIVALSKNKVGAILGALVFVSAQFTDFFLLLPGFIYSSIALQIILLGFFGVLRSEKGIRFKYVVMIIFGTYVLTSYSRTFLISVLALVVIALVYARELWSKRRVLVKVLSLVFLGTFPLILAYGKHFLSSYASTFGFYQAHYGSAFGAQSYAYHVGKSFVDAFVLSPAYSTFTTMHATWYQALYATVSLALAGTVIVVCSRIRGKSKLVALLLGSYVFSLALIASAKFLPQSIFISLTYHWLPFLANETSHFKLMPLLMSSIAIGFLPAVFQKKMHKNIFVGIVLLFCVVSLVPFVKQNSKLTKFQWNAMPQEYRETFYNGGALESAIILPSAKVDNEDPFGLAFPWAPYPYEFSQSERYIPLMSSNSRLVNPTQAELYDAIMNNAPQKQSEIFDLQNIFVFKDVQNAPDGTYDYFQWPKDYVKLSKDYYEALKANSDFVAVQDNEHFAQFAFKDAANSSFMLYSPKSMRVASIQSAFTTPLATDGSAPDLYLAPFTVQNDIQEKIAGAIQAKVSFKAPKNLSSVYYVKAEVESRSQDLVLQLNKTFWPNYQLVRISEKKYNAVSCANQTKNFQKTNNASCEYGDGMFGFSGASLLFAKPVKNATHLAGNYIGNTWVIPTSTSDSEKTQTLYFALVNKDQSAYTIANFAGCVAILVLVIFAILQERKLKNV